MIASLPHVTTVFICKVVRFVKHDRSALTSLPPRKESKS